MPTITLASWNIANAVWEEKDEKVRFGIRFKDIVEQSREWRTKHKVSLFAFQEIKGCKAADGKSELTTHAIAKAIGIGLGMPYTLQGQTEDPTWMHKALFYDAKEFSLEGTDLIAVPRPNREHEILNAHGTLLQHKTGLSLTVWNCHPNPDLPTRLAYCKALGMGITERVAKDRKRMHIVLGDLNTLQQDSEKQLAMLQDYFTNYTAEIKQTFKGFHYDVDPFGNLWVGKLDHVLVNKQHSQKVTDSMAFTVETPLSDHWPVICSLTIE
jgi:endonuclease/exonuclease/phosphatase family metal-dependent hydrolase